MELKRILPRKFHATSEEVAQVIALLRSFRVQSVPAQLPSLEVRDSDDLTILAAAMEAGAEVLVSGDRDLFEMTHARGLRIVNPRGFFELIAKELQ